MSLTMTELVKGSSKKGDADFVFRMIILGESGVGKTSILQRYRDCEFDESLQPTVGVDFSSKLLKRPQGLVKLQIWDSAGQEKYRSLTRTYFRNTIASVLVYDISDMKSFEAIEEWVNELEKYGNSNAVKLLIGNKTDLSHERKVSLNLGLNFAKRNKMIFCETSAKTNDMIGTAFEMIVEAVFKRLDAGEIDLTDASSGVKRNQLVINKQPAKKGCC